MSFSNTKARKHYSASTNVNKSIVNLSIIILDFLFSSISYYLKIILSSK